MGEATNNLAPYIHSPFTRIFGIAFTNQLDEECRDFIMDYAECLHAYGHVKGREVCRPYNDDYQECNKHYNATKRYAAIQAERKKQFKEGKLKELYFPGGEQF